MTALLLLPLLLLPGTVAPEVSPGPPAGAHRTLACADCHPDTAAPPDHAACTGCHGDAANIHPTRVQASFPVPEAYPLRDGAVFCETCHRLHEPTGPHSLRGVAPGMSLDLRVFCRSCHGDELSAQDPHRAERGTDRCSYCHASIDVKAILAGAAPRARGSAQRLCEVCHDLRASNHPRNIDPVLDVPSDLPRAPDGSITCVTCHDPHGSSTYTHYIRDKYARHFERGREENPHRDDRYACRSCHVRRSPEDITPASHELRFQGDAMLLCISCHVSARSHHPVGAPLPDAMAARLVDRGGLPLDGSGRIVCTTCHTNNCDSGQQRMSVLHYDAKHMELSLCWMCHPKEEFAKTDPHRKTVDNKTDGCVFCHDRAPVKGLERAEDLYFVSQGRMICLRCHETLSDFDVSHMNKTPTPEVLERLASYGKEKAMEFPLERDGRFTCTTCHNAHFSAKDEKNKTRLPSREMCALCHRR